MKHFVGEIRQTQREKLFHIFYQMQNAGMKYLQVQGRLFGKRSNSGGIREGNGWFNNMMMS